MTMLLKLTVFCIKIVLFNTLMSLCEGRGGRNVSLIRILSKKEVSEGMQGHIVGGVPVDIELFPSACVVRNSRGFCGGIILNSWTVLTAAHCLYHFDAYHVSVYTGSAKKQAAGGDKYYAAVLKVHENYNASNFINDIALIFVDRPIEFGTKVQKALIVNNEDWKNPAEKFAVIGWGRIDYRGPVSSVGLLQASMNFMPLDECAELHRENAPNAIFTKEMFCLYGDGKTDTCQGDSGTGVYWNNLLVGLVSHGRGCALKDAPSVYTNVHYLRSWIQSNVETFFNQCVSPK